MSERINPNRLAGGFTMKKGISEFYMVKGQGKCGGNVLLTPEGIRVETMTQQFMAGPNDLIFSGFDIMPGKDWVKWWSKKGIRTPEEIAAAVEYLREVENA
jgi:hypothetical protein